MQATLFGKTAIRPRQKPQMTHQKIGMNQFVQLSGKDAKNTNTTMIGVNPPTVPAHEKARMAKVKAAKIFNGANSVNGDSKKPTVKFAVPTPKNSKPVPIQIELQSPPGDDDADTTGLFGDDDDDDDFGSQIATCTTPNCGTTEVVAVDDDVSDFLCADCVTRLYNKKTNGSTSMDIDDDDDDDDVEDEDENDIGENIEDDAGGDDGNGVRYAINKGFPAKGTPLAQTNFDTVKPSDRKNVFKLFEDRIDTLTGIKFPDPPTEDTMDTYNSEFKEFWCAVAENPTLIYSAPSCDPSRNLALARNWRTVVFTVTSDKEQKAEMWHLNTTAAKIIKSYYAAKDGGKEMLSDYLSDWQKDPSHPPFAPNILEASAGRKPRPKTKSRTPATTTQTKLPAAPPKKTKRKREDNKADDDEKDSQVAKKMRNSVHALAKKARAAKSAAIAKAASSSNSSSSSSSSPSSSSNGLANSFIPAKAMTAVSHLTIEYMEKLTGVWPQKTVERFFVEITKAEAAAAEVESTWMDSLHAFLDPDVCRVKLATRVAYLMIMQQEKMRDELQAALAGNAVEETNDSDEFD